MSEDKREIAMLNRAGKSVLLDDYETELPWGTMFDRDGEETLDPEEAFSATVEMPDGSWRTLDLPAWEPITIH